MGPHVRAPIIRLRIVAALLTAATAITAGTVEVTFSAAGDAPSNVAFRLMRP